MKPLLTPEELATILNVSKSSVYRMVKDELIPFYHVRGHYRFILEEVLEALKNE